MKRQRVISLVAIILLLFPAIRYTHAATCTLSDKALMRLDWDTEHWYSPPWTATIADVRDVAGPGVEFDIHYLGNDDQNDSLHRVSSKWGGNGYLAGIDISSYEAFALRFRLISVDGSSAPDVAGSLIVGAMINWPEARYAYQPQVISLSGPTAAVSSTTSDAQQIETIGFRAGIPSRRYDASSPNPWNPNGSIVTLLVQPAEGATSIPEPTTLALLALGGGLLRRCKRSRHNDYLALRTPISSYG